MAGLIHIPGIAGCDEAGRGPLAGPVVCAAVVLPRRFDTRGINDSKKLSFGQRAVAEERIKRKADWAISVVEHDEIDAINILQASLIGMVRALESLSVVPEKALIDGNQLPPHSPCPCETQIQGDAAFACIAAASILAKNARDRIMIELHDRYPAYGFRTNFGYPTPEHLQALKEHGPTPYHRRTFAPVAAMLLQASFDFAAEPELGLATVMP